MRKSINDQTEKINPSDKMKQEFNKVQQDCNLMSKLTDMKSKIDLLQQELNYELQQLELVKKESAVQYPAAPPVNQLYPSYSGTNFPQQNSFLNYPNAPYWFPNASSSYYQSQYMFGYDNVNEAHSAFYNGLDHLDQMCNKEIRNTTQGICNLKKVKRNWMHCQPFNNLGSPAGDERKEIDTIMPAPSNKLFQSSIIKANTVKNIQVQSEEAPSMMQLGNSSSRPYSTVKRVQHGNHPLDRDAE